MHIGYNKLSTDAKVSKLNQYLSEEFKVKVDVNASIDDLVELKENTSDRMAHYKYELDKTAKDPEIAECLVIIEVASELLSEKRKLLEFNKVEAKKFKVVALLADNALRYINQGDDYDIAVKSVMRDYRGSTSLWPDHEIEKMVRQHIEERMEDDAIVGDIDEDFIKRMGGELEEGGDFYHPNTEHGSIDIKAIPKKQARDVPPTVYPAGSTKARFEPKDSGRETFNSARKKVMMGEDSSGFIHLAGNSRITMNPKTLKGNAIVEIGFMGNGEETTYPARVRFSYDDVGTIDIVSITDGQNQPTATEMDDSQLEELSGEILNELIEKGML